MYEASLFCTSSPTLANSSLFDNSHSNQCEVISHHGFDLYFHNKQWCWTSFHVLLTICISLKKMSIQLFCRFLTGFDNFSLDCLIFCCIVFILYILWILIPYQIYYFQIYFPIYQVAFSFWWWFPMPCRGFLVWYTPICLFFVLFPSPLESDPQKNC